MEKLDRLYLVNMWKDLKRKEKEEKKLCKKDDSFRFNQPLNEEITKVEKILRSKYKIDTSELFF